MRRSPVNYSDIVRDVTDEPRQVDRIREQFTRQAEAYARMRQATDEGALKGLVALARTAPSDRVLDVACGPAFLTMAFAEACGSAVGLDATDAQLDLARREAERRGLANLSFVSGEAEQLDVDDGSFDIVSCRAAFHHFAEPEAVLREMVRVARPAGALLIVDMLTSEDAAKAEAHNRIERLCDPTHVRALPASEFDALFAATGLEVEARPGFTLDYEVGEWIEHGGPSEETAAEIRRELEASIDPDRTGLHVRRERGDLYFSHTAAAFLLRKSRS